MRRAQIRILEMMAAIIVFLLGLVLYLVGFPKLALAVGATAMIWAGIIIVVSISDLIGGGS